MMKAYAYKNEQYTQVEPDCSETHSTLQRIERWNNGRNATCVANLLGATCPVIIGVNLRAGWAQILSKYKKWASYVCGMEGQSDMLSWHHNFLNMYSNHSWRQKMLHMLTISYNLISGCLVIIVTIFTVTAAHWL